MGQTQQLLASHTAAKCTHSAQLHAAAAVSCDDYASETLLVIVVHPDDLTATVVTSHVHRGIRVHQMHQAETVQA